MRIPPPILALGAGLAQRTLTKDVPPVTPIRKAAAVVAAAGASTLMGSALREFRASSTTVDPLHPERASALVTSGPFRFTRNPMYVGMAGLVAAHALLRGSPKAVLPLAAFVAVIDRIQIPPEEAAMTALFGADYESYRAAVARWVVI